MVESALGWHVAQRGCREAVDRHRLGQGIRIAMLDTGVDLSHPELRSQNVEQVDVTTRRGAGDDKSGHGTNIASLLVGRRLGLAPQAELISIKIACGRRPATEENVLQALDVCDKYNADLVHMSYGSTRHYPAVERAIAALSRRGVMTVASAGLNRNGQRTYPGDYSGVLGVASLRRDYSDFQQPPCPRSRFAEVGDNIVAATLRGEYKVVSGASIAAAIASGIVSLWLATGAAGSADERLLGDTQIDWLYCTADPCLSLLDRKVVMLSPARLFSQVPSAVS